MFLLAGCFWLLNFQVRKVYIDFAFYRNVLIYTIPFVVLFLFIVTTANINIGFLVGLFLVFVALKNVSSAIEAALEALLKHERIYLAVMGIVHGLPTWGDHC